MKTAGRSIELQAYMCFSLSTQEHLAVLTIHEVRLKVRTSCTVFGGSGRQEQVSSARLSAGRLEPQIAMIWVPKAASGCAHQVCEALQ